ncbi:hypothetical protein POVWA2_041220 [Plasmodium ovale wallikeri]|uniref:Uncharacterized protein n=1 Tax=Plasmodium ovale wallikeri TaxID=864142 RepID=A0A1A8ZBF2_PLAOA|nr:hypothetical protein POVWA2_041220 [Plasmodium ovale wallikeri]
MLQNGDIRKIPDREAANVQDDIDLLEVIGENFVRQIANKAEREATACDNVHEKQHNILCNEFLVCEIKMDVVDKGDLKNK